MIDRIELNKYLSKQEVYKLLDDGYTIYCKQFPSSMCKDAPISSRAPYRYIREFSNGMPYNAPILNGWSNLLSHAERTISHRAVAW